MPVHDAGVRDLKTHASQIIKRVRRGARYVITYRGRPVALLAPLENIPEGWRPNREAPSPWEELERLGKEIGKGWRSPLTTTELLSQSRR